MSFVLPALLVLLSGQASDDLPRVLKQFVDAYSAVEREAADPISAETAIYGGAIPGMLRRLDPHSVFFDPDQFTQLNEMQNSTRKGFGSIVSVMPGRVIILQALPGTPASRSGLGPGDEILAINGINLTMLDTGQLIQVLTESRQQPARLDVRRPGNARFLQFVLTPEELQTPSVERTFMLRPGIGYLRVASFDAETGQQIKAEIEKLGGAGLQGLVLDLRNNPGGLLPAALETCSLFLKPSGKVLTVRGRSAQPHEETTPRDALPYTFPVAVLINDKTASAAEIVAGALQDHDRAVILGQPSFGKGLVQSVYPLSERTGVALTTAYYYTPSGRSIQKPLSASLIRPWDPSQTEFRTDSGRPVRGGGGIQPDYVVYPEPVTRFRAAIEQSGAFTSFATDFVRKSGTIREDFDVTPDLLDRFHAYLSENNIRPGVGEWSSERDWIASRLRTEIFNLSLGVARGDEIEAQRDPVIRSALDKLGSPLTAANSN
jgi:carboxyl-terminal processing protease